MVGKRLNNKVDDVQSALANAETIDTILLAFSSNIQEVRRGAIHAIIKLSAQSKHYYKDGVHSLTHSQRTRAS